MEDLPVEQLVPELLTSLTPSALTTSATFLPWPSRTSASRSLAMISSARKPLRGIDLPPNALQALTSAWTYSRGEGHNDLPGLFLGIEKTAGGEPALRMIMREEAGEGTLSAPSAPAPQSPRRPAMSRPEIQQEAAPVPH